MTISNIIKNQCPNCKQANVFQSSNLFSYRTIKMNDHCPVCQLDFIKEPGFYWGAMYVSYGLAILEGLGTCTINSLLGIPVSDTSNLWIIIFVMLLLSPFNFRMARIIWLYILPGINSHRRLHQYSNPI